MVEIRHYTKLLPDPVQMLERHLEAAGITLLRFVFESSFFIAPKAVRAKTPYFPDRARYSSIHYPGLRKGDWAVWDESQTRVRLDDNSRAQMAWQRYTRRALARGKGYALRHIWGNPWNPIAFTAGWNLVYTPDWVGLRTEAQAPHVVIQTALQQASWDLFFRENPVCTPPDFVSDPGLDLGKLLKGQSLLVLVARHGNQELDGRSIEDLVRAVKAERHQSWSNVTKAIAAEGGQAHEPFGTPNVEASARQCVRKMLAETGLDLAALSDVVERIQKREAL